MVSGRRVTILRVPGPGPVVPSRLGHVDPRIRDLTQLFRVFCRLEPENLPLLGDGNL